MARTTRLGILRAKTDDVPGSVRILDKIHQEPLGIDPDRPPSPSHPSEPVEHHHHHHRPHLHRQQSAKGKEKEQKKRTADGKIILDPQPDDSRDDPLNWPAWRRDAALLVLGWHALVGGGQTPILAAGFNDVAKDFGVTVPDVALTTGIYMLGLGIGALFVSPLAILYGKRPVYLGGAVLFMLASLWCAASPSYGSLVAARIIMGIGVSPCECLPSATIAEIFFLHERAYRVGIYTLLLLGGKNLVPLVSGAIIGAEGWRWVFWIVAIIVGFNIFLLFLFVPETFWDRTPRPSARPSILRRISDMTRSGSLYFHRHSRTSVPSRSHSRPQSRPQSQPHSRSSSVHRPAPVARPHHLVEDLHRTEPEQPSEKDYHSSDQPVSEQKGIAAEKHAHFADQGTVSNEGALLKSKLKKLAASVDGAEDSAKPSPKTGPQKIEGHTGTAGEPTTSKTKYIDGELENKEDIRPEIAQGEVDAEKADWKPRKYNTLAQLPGHDPSHPEHHGPPKTFVQQLRIWNGRLRKDSFIKTMCRPLVLFAYPAVLWSAVVYALSVGWLIVLSETVAHIYQAKPYNFSRLGTGLVYLSPFIGGILGTAVAGKASDIIVRFMSRRNDGIYEPEFRLVMAFPIAITTAMGLMGFGWSAYDHDNWIVPTVFFGVISFGCSLGSTTAITFCLDSYSQYAGEALVNLNVAKNVLHGFVFSLFFNRWLDSQGSKTVFLALGGIQLVLLAFSVPLYIYGKRLRLWTAHANLMAKL